MNLLAPGPSTRQICLRSSVRMASASAFAASSGDANVLWTNAGRAFAGASQRAQGRRRALTAQQAQRRWRGQSPHVSHAAARDAFMLSCWCSISGPVPCPPPPPAPPPAPPRLALRPPPPPAQALCAARGAARCGGRRRALHRRAALRAAIGVALHLWSRFGLEADCGCGRAPAGATCGRGMLFARCLDDRNAPGAGRVTLFVARVPGRSSRGRRRPAQESIAGASARFGHCRGRDSSRASARWRCWSAGSGCSPPQSR